LVSPAYLQRLPLTSSHGMISAPPLDGVRETSSLGSPVNNSVWCPRNSGSSVGPFGVNLTLLATSVHLGFATFDRLFCIFPVSRPLQIGNVARHPPFAGVARLPDTRRWGCQTPAVGCQKPTVLVARHPLVTRHPPFGEGNSNCRRSPGVWVSGTPGVWGSVGVWNPSPAPIGMGLGSMLQRSDSGRAGGGNDVITRRDRSAFALSCAGAAIERPAPIGSGNAHAGSARSPRRPRSEIRPEPCRRLVRAHRSGDTGAPGA
jgi:hypothetical protein